VSKSENWVLTLTPHRSLSREGFLAVMTLIAGINLVVGLMFFVIGAWPIVAFLGLDVLMIWWAFKANFADAARSERLAAKGDELVLSRFTRDGLQEDTVFNRRWVKVDLEFDSERELVGKLFLRSHGRAHEIASFLGAEERQSLAKELRRAI
jgi:uncharacterized membrane protein